MGLEVGRAGDRASGHSRPHRLRSDVGLVQRIAKDGPNLAAEAGGRFPEGPERILAHCGSNLRGSTNSVWPGSQTSARRPEFGAKLVDLCHAGHFWHKFDRFWATFVKSGPSSTNFRRNWSSLARSRTAFGEDGQFWLESGANSGRGRPPPGRFRPMRKIHISPTQNRAPKPD